MQGREENISLAMKLAMSQAELHTAARHLESSRRSLRELDVVRAKPLSQYPSKLNS